MKIWTSADANWHRLVDYFIVFITVYGVWALSSYGMSPPIVIGIGALFVVVAIAQRLSIMARNNEIRCARTRENALRLVHLPLRHAGCYAQLAMDQTGNATHLHELRLIAAEQFLDAAYVWNLSVDETLRALLVSDTDIRVLRDVMDEMNRTGNWPGAKQKWADALVAAARNPRYEKWTPEQAAAFEASLVAAGLPNEDQTDTD